MCCALPAAALLIRPDRDDSEYVELASRYSSSVLLNAPDGEGVLIASRWVLTAAHMAKALQEMKSLPKLEFGGREYEIRSLHIHPDWKKGGAADICAAAAPGTTWKGVCPTLIYRDKDEGGKSVRHRGPWLYRKIGEKPLPKERWDRKKRAAITCSSTASRRARSAC